jgi:hypothetical protein
MKKKLFSITTLFVCSALVCLAVFADLTGKWTGSLKTPDGNEFPITYVFKADGNALTGALQGQQGEIPITEGKINGNDFSFKLDFNGTPIVNTGKYYVDSIGIDSEVNGGKFHVKLKRVVTN